jgi:hypothetical protein
MKSQRQRTPQVADQFNRENYPRTFAALDAREDWIGVCAAEQTERYIAKTNDRTQRALRPCRQQVERVVELLCPIGLVPAADRRPAADLAPHSLARLGYGPAGLPPAGVVALAVSPTQAHMLTLGAWPEVADLEQMMAAHKMRRRDAWIAIADLIESGNLVGLARFIALRLGRNGIADIGAQHAMLRNNGLTPLLVVMTVTPDECLRDGPLGTMQIIVLPAALERQLAESA